MFKEKAVYGAKIKSDEDWDLTSSHKLGFLVLSSIYSIVTMPELQVELLFSLWGAANVQSVSQKCQQKLKGHLSLCFPKSRPWETRNWERPLEDVLMIMLLWRAIGSVSWVLCEEACRKYVSALSGGSSWGSYSQTHWLRIARWGH